MNKDDNIISLSSLFEPSIENNVDDFEMIEIDDEPPKDNNNIINLNDILNQEELLDVEDNSAKKKDYDNIIEKIQIGLIVFLIVIGTLIYFFGYDFFEPYIKID